MPFNPEQYNLTDINGLSVAFNPELGWSLAIQSPNSSIINQIPLSVVANLITGSLTFPDGVLSGLELTFNNGTTPKTVSVSEGQWRINNEIFNLNVPEVSNINAPSATGRTDAIIADSTGLVYYQPNYSGTPPVGSILVSPFTVKADGSDIISSPTIPVNYAVMNGLNQGDLNITGQFLINGVPIGSGGGSSALTFTIPGSEIDANGNINMGGRTGMPVAGTLPSAKQAYGSDGQDYSQGLSYFPDTQILNTGLYTDAVTELIVKITF